MNPEKMWVIKQKQPMVSGGSKGSVIDIAQIMACVGQQHVNVCSLPIQLVCSEILRQNPNVYFLPIALYKAV